MSQPVALALQGGGTHGAFTWGVLDRLLHEVASGHLRITAISGSSAGAINGALCAYGLSAGMTPENAEKTRALLADFWQALAEKAFVGGNAFLGGLVPNYLTGWNLDWSPVAIWMEMASRVFSPYNNPFYSNSLSPLLERFFPAEAIAAINQRGAPKLHVCAVNIRNNRRRIFTQPGITVDSLLASACLPHQFQAIPIETEFYWDGGYIGNPALGPLLKSADDIIVVMLNPLHVHDIPPRSARQILDRLNEINFNAPLVLEINSIHAINKVLKKLPSDQAAATGYKHLRLHFIQNDKYVETLGFVGKENASIAFLKALFEAGQETAESWLHKHRANIGKMSTCNWKAEPCNLEADILDPALKGGHHVENAN